MIAGRTRDALVARRASGHSISRPAVVDRGELAQRIQSLRNDGATLQAIADALKRRGGADVAWRRRVAPVSCAVGHGIPAPTAVPPSCQPPHHRTTSPEGTTASEPPLGR